ncbi:MAG: TetR/AcrR family transcriptional regulator [Spirochaetia bacterium]|nr:TetR/AcrR family transcriptional regulator [Spirochaetia bacterium]
MKDRKQPWVQEAFRILFEKGPTALTIDLLCKRLKQTKGAFYHHFKDRSDLVRILLVSWEAASTDDVITQACTESDPEKRIKLLTALTHDLPRNPERAIRAWSLRAPEVAEIQERVDRKRVAFLESVYIAMGNSKTVAKRRSRITYALFVGGGMLMPPMSKYELDRLYLVLRPNRQTVRAK